jgi:3-methyladenine DNA glycosylase AlkD
MAPEPRTSAATAAGSDGATPRAADIVDRRRPIADALGRHLGELVQDPDALLIELSRGLDGLSDPAYLAGQRRVAPGIGELHGVRSPLLAAVRRGFVASTRRDPPALLLLVADRLLRAPTLEEHWFAVDVLERTLGSDPERSWQLLRRAARQAGDWITVDSLASAVGRGILLEPYRWAELEQLVFSSSRWERRLVGSTIARIPYVDRRLGRDPAVAARSLALVSDLIGDAQPDVQKALSWALRSMAVVDRQAVDSFCRDQAAIAARDGDGHRAWVVRDTLGRLSPATAEAVRRELTGVRRRLGVPSTSRAAETAARFAGAAGLPDPTDLPEPPL